MKLKFFLLFALILSSFLSFSADQEASPAKAEKKDSLQRLAIFLDLDECLIHSVATHNPTVEASWEMGLEALDIQAEMFPYSVFPRPGVREFLEECTAHFDTYIFTAASKDYADAIVDQLDPERKLKGRFYRGSCTHKKCFLPGQGKMDISIKEIAQFSHISQPISRRVLVDNSLFSFFFAPRNALLVKDWEAETLEDRELERVLTLLHKIAEAPDVREALTKEGCDLTKIINLHLKFISDPLRRSVQKSPSRPLREDRAHNNDNASDADDESEELSPRRLWGGGGEKDDHFDEEEIRKKIEQEAKPWIIYEETEL